MVISNWTKLVVLIAIIAILVVGISIGGPKFINFMQIQFGSKGKVELLERCIQMPGCSIGPADLEFYERYQTVRGSETAKKIKSEAEERLMEEKE